MFEGDRQSVDPKSVASIILGGGAGTRLFPLTGKRAKPAVREPTIFLLLKKMILKLNGTICVYIHIHNSKDLKKSLRAELIMLLTESCINFLQNAGPHWRML